MSNVDRLTVEGVLLCGDYSLCPLPPGTDGHSRLQQTPIVLNSDSLSQLDLMVQKHVVNQTIIIAFANANHLDYAFNWLAYIGLLNITNYLIGAMDSTTADALARAGAQHFDMFHDTPSAVMGLLAGLLNHVLTLMSTH